MKLKQSKTYLSLLCIGLFSSACSSNDSIYSDSSLESEIPQILVSTSLWGDVVSNVVCDGSAEINVIIPAGSDPHTFELSLTDRKLMEEADLIISNGLFLEEGLTPALEELSSEGKPLFQFSDHVELLSYDKSNDLDQDKDHDEDSHEDEDEHDDEDEDTHDGDDEHGDEHGDSDPHIWLDPTLVSTSLDELATVLKDDINLDAAAVDRCTQNYQSLLAQTDSEIETLVGQVKPEDKKLVTNHDAFSYYAKRYGFDIVGVVIPSPSELAETNPAQLQELADLIRNENIKAIFAESQHSDKDAQALANEIGSVEVVSLYSGTLGEKDSGADTYIGYLKTNTNSIVDALK